MTTRVYLVSLLIALLMLLCAMIASLKAPAQSVPTAHAAASQWFEQFNGRTAAEALSAASRWYQMCQNHLMTDADGTLAINSIVVDHNQSGWSIVLYLDTGNFVEDSGAWCC